jgi:hypothetical protein
MKITEEDLRGPVGVAIFYGFFIVLFIIGLIVGSISAARHHDEELARDLRGAVVDTLYRRGARILLIATDTGIVTNSGADLADTVVIGDSVIKQANSPYALVVRNGRKLGYYWYSGSISASKVGGDTIPPQLP